MNYKEVNRDFYDTHAEEFTKNVKNLLANPFLRQESDIFLQELSGERILDLGSGSGRNSGYFRSKEYHPVCFDFSRGMLELCKQRRLESLAGDLEKLPFGDNSFDGVWAVGSLLHSPKRKLPNILRNIQRILKEDGILYISVKEGEGEGYVVSDKYPDVKRFFAFYDQDSFARRLEKHFEILHRTKTQIGDATFLNYLCSV